ncbi:MAG: TonB-dependent receptor [Vicinamibacteria bacterium]|nr:TonB-dependent receptor [Vicinamibacteria bacterium]
MKIPRIAIIFSLTCMFFVPVTAAQGKKREKKSEVGGGARRRARVRQRNARCAIKGRVADLSGQPLSGARLVAGEATTRSGEDGEFCLDVPTLGEYDVRAEMPGFAASSAHVHVGDSIMRADVNIMLTPSFRDTIVVSATRTEKRLDEVPVRTEVVSRESIEKVAARTLADAIEYATGVRVENNCQNCNFQQIRLLGLDGAYSQILIDGAPLVSSLAQVYGVEHIPAEMIERVEVVKGGGSAVYGPGSVAGVINVISHVTERNGGFFNARQESMDGKPARSLGGSLDWIPRERAQVNAFAQFDRVDPVDLTGDGFTEAGRRRLDAIGMHFGGSVFGDAGKIRLEAGRLYEDRRGGNRLDLPESQADVAESVKSTRYNVGASFSHRPSPRIDYRLTASFVHSDRDSYYGSGMDPNAYGFSRNPLWVLDGQVNRCGRSRILSLGVQWTSDRLEDKQPAYERFTADTYRNIGAYVQDDWGIIRGVQLLYGIRVDKHSVLENPVLSPRVALRIGPRPDWGLRASIARGFRAPQVFDEDLHITQVGGEGQVIRNAFGLKQESSTNLVFSSEWTPSFRGGSALFEVSLFHTRIADLFNVQAAEDPDRPGAEFERVNAGSARVHGFEANVGVILGSHARLEMGYVEQRSRFDDPEPDFGSRDFFRTPDRYGVASLVLKQPRLAELFIGARYTGAMRIPHYAGYVQEDRLEKSSTFCVLDVNLRRTFFVGAGRLTVGIGVRNLTDSYQSDLDQGPDRDAGYVYGPRYPRSFFGTAKVSF